MIRKSLPLLAAGMALVATPAAAQRPTGEAALARALEGRVAGNPVNCINLRQVSSSQVIDRTAIVYRIGSTLYVNRPRAGANSLSNWDTQVQRPFNSRLCSIDPVTIIDPASGMFRGTVFLGEFVPYRRVRN
jgi:hypothetical protein